MHFGPVHDRTEVHDQRGGGHQPAGSGRPSSKPAPDWTPTTARSANSGSVLAPTYVHALRTPDVMWSSRSSTPGRRGSRYIRELEMPSSKRPLRARSKGLSAVVRAATARAGA